MKTFLSIILLLTIIAFVLIGLAIDDFSKRKNPDDRWFGPAVAAHTNCIPIDQVNREIPPILVDGFVRGFKDGLDYHLDPLDPHSRSNAIWEYSNAVHQIVK